MEKQMGPPFRDIIALFPKPILKSCKVKGQELALKYWKQLPKPFSKCPYLVLVLGTVPFLSFSPHLCSFIQLDYSKCGSQIWFQCSVCRVLSKDILHKDVKTLFEPTFSWPYCEGSDLMWFPTHSLSHVTPWSCWWNQELAVFKDSHL